MHHARRRAALSLAVLMLACSEGHSLDFDGGLGAGGAGQAGGGGHAAGGGGGQASGGASAGGAGGVQHCAPVRCSPCPYGPVLDANGCQTCICQPPPGCPALACAAPGAADVPAPTIVAPRPDAGTVPPTDPGPPCPYGRVLDMNGCPLCQCKPPPPCTPADCGGPAGEPTGPCAPICSRNAVGACTWVAPPCAPPPPCNSLTDQASCGQSAGCRWLAPGCGTPALPATGCYDAADVDCGSAKPCRNRKVCATRSVNPCPGGKCAACSESVAVCL